MEIAVNAGALAVIAIVHVLALLRARRRDRIADAARPVPRARQATVQIPQLCGRAVRYAGMTDTCSRRAGHAVGRCLTDAEIVSVVEGSVVHTVVPAIGDTDLRVDIAALGRHVDSCPSRLFEDEVLHRTELEWLVRTRLMTEALVSGERFSEWGETRA